MSTILPPIFSLINETEVAFFCVVAGIIAMLASRFEDVAVLAFGPLKAELREKIDEADKTLEATKQIAGTTAKAALDLIQNSGRLGGLSDKHRDEIYKSYGEILDDLKIDRVPIEEFWHASVEYDYGFMALGRNQVPQGATKEEILRWEGMNEAIEDRATPEDIRSFLNDTGYMTPEREELIVDLEYYLEHHEHRRPEVWADKKRYFVHNRLTRPARTGGFFHFGLAPGVAWCAGKVMP